MAAARGSNCWRSHTLSSADEQAEAGGQVEAEGSKGGCSCPQPAPAMQDRQLDQPKVPCWACHLGAKPPLLRRHVRLALGGGQPVGQGGLQDPRRVGRASQISLAVVQVQLAQLRWAFLAIFSKLHACGWLKEWDVRRAGHRGGQKNVPTAKQLCGIVHSQVL